MSRTYKATGINLKSMALGEADRLLTVLTREFGLIRVVAPGSRKHLSKLGGRSGLFVVNELLIAKGRSLDKITQAETLESYPGLSRDLGKLAASQYLAEMVLHQALSEQPQEELYYLLNEHLSRLEGLPKAKPFLVYAYLTHAIFHLLALAGITPQVQVCCLSQRPLTPDFDTPNWQVGFSVSAGGIISLPALERLQSEGYRTVSVPTSPLEQPKTLAVQPSTYTVSSSVAPQNAPSRGGKVAEPLGTYQVRHRQEKPTLNARLNATELALLQQLAGAMLPQTDAASPVQLLSSDTSWIAVERILRQYVQYHIGQPIRSAALIDSYFASLPTSSTKHDATV